MVKCTVPEKYQAKWNRVEDFLDNLYLPLAAQLAVGTITGSSIIGMQAVGWPRHSFAIGSDDEYFLLHLYLERQEKIFLAGDPSSLLLNETQTPKALCISEGIVCSECLRPKCVGLPIRILYEECVCGGFTSARLRGKEGQTVRLEGLSATHMNGKEGTLKRLDPQRGRHPVQLLQSKKNVAVRPENIELASVRPSPSWIEGRNEAEENDQAEKLRKENEERLKAERNPRQQTVGTEFFGEATKAARKEEGRKYRCAGCNKIFDRTLYPCSQCQSVAYCGRECQAADWPKHKSLCKTVAKINKEHLKQGFTTSQIGSMANLGHQAGRVHPLEDVIKNSPPVVREGAPNFKELHIFCGSKKGKRVKKLLRKYYRKDLTTQRQAPRGQELEKLITNSVNATFHGWTLLEARDPSYNHEDVCLQTFFDMLCHNEGAQDQISLHGEDGLILLDFYARLGGNLAKHYSLDGYAIIHHAARYDIPKVIEFLVREGVDPNQSTGLNSYNSTTASTPLHIAIMSLNIRSVEILVGQPDIDLSRRNLAGKAPLHSAANTANDNRSLSDREHDDDEFNEIIRNILDILEKAGADVEVLTKGAWKSKHTAPGIHEMSDGLNICDIASNHAASIWCITHGIAPTRRGSWIEEGMQEHGFPVDDFHWEYIHFFIKSRKFAMFLTQSESEKKKTIQASKFEAKALSLMSDD